MLMRGLPRRAFGASQRGKGERSGTCGRAALACGIVPPGDRRGYEAGAAGLAARAGGQAATARRAEADGAGPQHDGRGREPKGHRRRSPVASGSYRPLPAGTGTSPSLTRPSHRALTARAHRMSARAGPRALPSRGPSRRAGPRLARALASRVRGQSLSLRGVPGDKNRPLTRAEAGAEPRAGTREPGRVRAPGGSPPRRPSGGRRWRHRRRPPRRGPPRWPRARAPARPAAPPRRAATAPPRRG